MVAAMPGTTLENALLLHETCLMLNEGHDNDDIYKFTEAALSLIGFSYQALAIDTDSPSHFHAFQPSDTDSGFNMGNAITGGIIGDLLDNGSLDFSGGAITGAIIGGMFD
jgi:hypothetical protein